ncbi:MAG: pyridoxamine 5'-phosphate oxidase family protein [Chloroflexi bacterium]|nr:pyridoxamine 5'-phosphate oxidase family protein [Chloroflexota bacterium]
MVEFSEQQRAFLNKARSAAMIVMRPDGSPSAVRVGVSLVDGRLWSSGTAGRRRTTWLRANPRGTVVVFDSGYGYLTVEANVRLREGPGAVDDSVRLFRAMEGRPTGPLLFEGRELSEDEFRAAMRDQQRLVYEFEPRRVYGSV